MQKAILSLVVAVIILLWVAICHADTASDILVCRNIGDFIQYNCECREGRGILVTADHFGEDHKDVTCDVTYYSKTEKMSVKAEVTLHGGSSDANRWLVHEVDKEFRTYYGTPGQEYVVKKIDGNALYTFGSKGWNYRWVSENKVIMLEYHDTGMTKPEPIKIVKAYVAKYPSSIAPMTTQEMNSASNEMKWIKDEMDRRLLLCDKWLQYLFLKKNVGKQVREEPVESMNVFLDYREKYFGVNAEPDKNLLVSYLNSNNGTGVKAKLTEYKAWWAANKSRTIRMEITGNESVQNDLFIKIK
jgi:hypothetical protein